MINVSHLTKKYKNTHANDNISFIVDSGEIAVLAGSNGAGKSTTMNIICGVLNQTEGTVYINGIDTRENPVEAKKYIGFLPQKPPLYTDHNVDEYLTYCAHLRLMNDREVKAAVELAKERCGIVHFSKRLVKNLSGGYQQRLGIAQAIVHNPKLVVLDEPTNGLDPNQILEIRELIREIAQDHAVLLSTHILSEVEAICHTIKMIEHGNLIFSGSIDEFHNSVKSNNCIVRLENAPAEEELRNIPGVIKVKKIDERTFRVQFEREGEEEAKRVAEICVNRGWRLSEIQMEKVSMDEIFAQLSGKRVVDKF